MHDVHLLFIHGYTGSGSGDWFPAIAAELKRYDVSFSMPDFPGGDRPQSERWLELIDREVKKASKPVVIIGQSLGTRAAMLYLHEHPEVRVKAVFLIATFNNDLELNRYRRGEGYANFWQYPVDTAQLKGQAEKWVVIHSYDDRNLHYSQAQDISRQLGAKLILTNGRAHFGGPSHAGYIFRILQKELRLVGRSWFGILRLLLSWR